VSAGPPEARRGLERAATRVADDESTLEPARRERPSPDEGPPRPALVIAWLEGEPGLHGAALLPEEVPRVFGRGEGDGAEPRLTPVRQEPGSNRPLSPPRAAWMSRRQLRVQLLGDDRVHIEGLGRVVLRVRGAPCAQAILSPDRPGERVTLGQHAVLMVVRRPQTFPPLQHWRLPLQPPGTPDPVGLVGESASLWALRDRLAFVARQRGHVLVLGPSGAGKERVARALHALSSRAGRRLVSRNAATIPPSLMDAELFGHVADFPNPGMRERPGLVGEAQGGTLFLDEIGELPEELQAHLLRLMDAGEYQRLGDARIRHADMRLIAATNRGPEALKPDLRARFRHVVEVPPLAARRDDVPLLLHHLVCSALAEDPALSARLLADGAPRLAIELIEAALVHPLPLQVRELEALLWDAIAASTGERLGPGPALLRAAASPERLDAASPEELTRDAVLAAIERHDGVLERVWRELGLSSRYALRRLMKRHGLRG